MNQDFPIWRVSKGGHSVCEGFFVEVDKGEKTTAASDKKSYDKCEYINRWG